MNMRLCASPAAARAACCAMSWRARAVYMYSEYEACHACSVERLGARPSSCRSTKAHVLLLLPGGPPEACSAAAL